MVVDEDCTCSSTDNSNKHCLLCGRTASLACQCINIFNIDEFRRPRIHEALHRLLQCEPSDLRSHSICSECVSRATGVNGLSQIESDLQKKFVVTQLGHWSSSETHGLVSTDTCAKFSDSDGFWNRPNKDNMSALMYLYSKLSNGKLLALAPLFWAKQMQRASWCSYSMLNKGKISAFVPLF